LILLGNRAFYYIKYIKQLNTAINTTPSLITTTAQLTTADVFVIVSPGTVNYGGVTAG
jgi:hypothetical protein